MIEFGAEDNIWVIFERIEEIKSNIEVKEFHDSTLKRGDYIRTYNGYYVPVTNAKRFRKEKTVLVEIHVPMHKYSFSIHDEKPMDEKSIFMRFMWSRDVHYSQLRKRLKPKEAVVVKLMGEGVGLEAAIAMAYGTGRVQENQKIAWTLIKTEKFIKELYKEVMGNTFQTALEDVGITSEFIAMKFKEILDMPIDKAWQATVKMEAVAMLNGIVKEEKINLGGGGLPKSLPGHNRPKQIDISSIAKNRLKNAKDIDYTTSD